MDKNGNMTCSNAKVTGGKITLEAGTSANPNFTIGDNLYITGNYFNMGREYLGGNFIQMFADTDDPAEISVNSNMSQTRILGTKIETPVVTQTSLLEYKKNIEKLESNAIEIIKNIDIYKYNLINENDTDKKHIGFIIGDNYKYSKEVTSIDNDGVDNYSFTSLLCKALQEQQEEIELLKQEIIKLKGEQ